MIEASITRLVQEAPTLDPAVVDMLIEALRANGSPLALSIARVVELVGEELVDPGIALPALAMACRTLVDAALSDREREAARYEIETLLPVPTKPDVPVAALSRAPRRRT